jgi:hypothetical protein
LVGHWQSFDGKKELELEANGEYRFSGTFPRQGRWGVVPGKAQLALDNQICPIALGPLGPVQPTDVVMDVRCGNGSFAELRWFKKFPAGHPFLSLPPM